MLQPVVIFCQALLVEFCDALDDALGAATSCCCKYFVVVGFWLLSLFGDVFFDVVDSSCMVYLFVDLAAVAATPVTVLVVHP